MARKNKISEMKDRLKEYRAFSVEVDFIAYKAAICVLATSVGEAREKLDDAYPGVRTTITNQLTAIIV